MDGITDSMDSLSKLRETVKEFLTQNHQLQHSMSPSTGCNSTHPVPAPGHHSPVAFRVSNAHTHPGACLLRDHQRLWEKQPPPPQQYPLPVLRQMCNCACVALTPVIAPRHAHAP